MQEILFPMAQKSVSNDTNHTTRTNDTVAIGIVGASGYGGGELLRLLSRHPRAHVRTAVSETYAGKPVTAAWPGLERQTELRFEPFRDGEAVAECDVVFLAMENGKAMELAPRLLENGARVIDLSADFRFRDVETYRRWYGAEHACPQWAADAAYGLPELHRERIAGARLVGNPGCYPTASILGLAPLVNAGLIDASTTIIDAKSGVSGAGRSKFALAYHYPEINESVSAYKVSGTHRHTPEIEAQLGALSGQQWPITFTPHLIPMTRGILATCYATLKAPAAASELNALYSEFYRDAPFVVLCENDLPATKHTLGSNRCHIAVTIDARISRVTVVSVIDNLVKGMAGQAIQNMNLMLGMPETLGLDDIGGFWP